MIIVIIITGIRSSSQVPTGPILNLNLNRQELRSQWIRISVFRASHFHADTDHIVPWYTVLCTVLYGCLCVQAGSIQNLEIIIWNSYRAANIFLVFAFSSWPELIWSILDRLFWSLMGLAIERILIWIWKTRASRLHSSLLSIAFLSSKALYCAFWEQKIWCIPQGLIKNRDYHIFLSTFLYRVMFEIFSCIHIFEHPSQFWILVFRKSGPSIWHQT